MSLPMPVGRRSGLRFRLLGFPVAIDVSFLIVLGFLGYGVIGRGIEFLLVWVVIAAASVLVHEVGHALVARAAGAAPDITLSGFGGLTRFAHPAGGLSRGRSVAISLAGPATGLVLGAGLLALRRAAAMDPGSLSAYALDVGIFVTLGWGLLNLLPILPLDGGNVLVELLPGALERRRRLGAGVSVVVAVLAAAVAVRVGQPYAALLAGWFALGNVTTARTRPPAPPAPPAPLSAEQQRRRAEDSRAVRWLVESGRVPEACHLANTAPAGIDASTAGILRVAIGEVDAAGG